MISKKIKETFISSLPDAKVHLAFLFATPLVVRVPGEKSDTFRDNFKKHQLLEFKREFKEIKQSLK